MAELTLPTDSLDWPRSGTHFEARPMRVEEVEDCERLVVRAELPGIDCRRDLDVRIRGHMLEIRAERRPGTLAADAQRHSEFEYGRFWRVLTLPRAARESEVNATYPDGILEVRVRLDDVAPNEGTRITVEAGRDA
jgi:HSP20 family molecular chaperone IbpA